MIQTFNVSVIIPVYNAVEFVRKAVESAVLLPEVVEVILVEDSSPDNAIEICKQLVNEYPKVTLFQHPDNKNHGAGASRNLGIKNAQCEYIAFLDADDYYLPNRFETDKKILLSNDDIDGVYNALGIHYYSEEGKRKFIDAGFKYQEFFTISGNVPPDELFYVLFSQHKTIVGEFSTVTITVRKTIFQKVGYFNTQLRLKQDTHLWRRMAAKCRLASGNIKEPVAIRGVHDQNRMVNTEDYKIYDSLWWKDLNNWMKNEKVNKEYLKCFRLSYLYFQIKSASFIKTLPAFLLFFIRNRGYIRKKHGVFDTYFINFCGRNFFSLHFISFKNKCFHH